MEIKITQVDESKRRASLPGDTQLGFGRYFTDHMFKVDYDPEGAWHDARIEPYGPLNLDPACIVFHYAQEIFEGLKAYRGVDGGIRLFRHMKNIERMQRSAERLCMPAFGSASIPSWACGPPPNTSSTSSSALWVRTTLRASTP